jgi:hypothetical protein
MAWEGLGGVTVTFSIDMRLAVFLRVLCELMTGYSLKDVKSIYMRVCCARMSSDVLSDVEDGVFSIILHLRTGRTSHFAEQAAIFWVEWSSLQNSL